MARRPTSGTTSTNPWATMEEPTLLSAVVDKKPGSWAGFYARYERLIITCIKKVLHRYTALYGDEDIEDMVNTVCLNLIKDDFRKLRSYDASRGYKLSSWVGLIATNTAHDALRRREPIHRQLSPIDDDDGGTGQMDFADAGPTPGEALEKREQWNTLVAAIQELPESDRQFLELYYEKELEPEEIAKVMGISVNTVYSRKNKVREKLRKIIEDLSGGKIEGLEA